MDQSHSVLGIKAVSVYLFVVECYGAAPRVSIKILTLFIFGLGLLKRRVEVITFKIVKLVLCWVSVPDESKNQGEKLERYG